MNYLYYVINLLIFICLSGCSSNHPPRDIYVTDISNPLNKSNQKLQYINNSIDLSDQNKQLDSSNKKHCPVNRIYHHSYHYSNKGSYSSCCYTVKPGDTLFYIAWITGNDYRVLANRNNIRVDGVLKVGQILQVGRENQQLNSEFFRQYKNTNNKDHNFHQKCKHGSSCLSSLKEGCYNDNSINDINVNTKGSHMLKNNFVNLLSLSNKDISSSNKKNIINHNKTEVRNVVNITNKSSIIWTWPAYGKIINGFSSFEGGKKGIEISGNFGQPIFSSAAGKVVYAGNALVGYGNLIIIKHCGDFLSTYAHNDKILVSEQQYVQSGQKIATMGNSESDIIKLYFEIRYRGKSVDPLYYLPKK